MFCNFLMNISQHYFFENYQQFYFWFTFTVTTTVVIRCEDHYEKSVSRSVRHWDVAWTSILVNVTYHSLTCISSILFKFWNVVVWEICLKQDLLIEKIYFWCFNKNDLFCKFVFSFADLVPLTLSCIVC